MKKIVLFAMLAMSIVACKKKSDADTTTTSPTTEVVAPAQNTTVEVPTFTDPSVQNYVQSYTTYIEEYKKAHAEKNLDKLAELALRGAELIEEGKKVTTVAGEEANKLNDYLAKRTQELENLTK